jgi:hypothetical protein
MPAAEVARLGVEQGLKLTADDVHKIRSSERRAAAEAKTTKRYARGYD